MHVDQATLVFEAKGIDPSRYSFSVGDVLRDKWPDGPFDVVLCLGLLYHVSDPIGLLDRISETNTDLLAIDTAVADGARIVPAVADRLHGRPPERGRSEDCADPVQ